MWFLLGLFFSCLVIFSCWLLHEAALSLYNFLCCFFLGQISTKMKRWKVWKDLYCKLWQPERKKTGDCSFKLHLPSLHSRLRNSLRKILSYDILKTNCCVVVIRKVIHTTWNIKSSTNHLHHYLAWIENVKKI